MENILEKENILVSVVLPTYNEASNIVPLIKRINCSLQNCCKEIIVVDDDSPDKTWEIAKELDNPDVRVIRRLNEKGLNSALRGGLLNLMENILFGWTLTSPCHQKQFLLY